MMDIFYWGYNILLIIAFVSAAIQPLPYKIHRISNLEFTSFETGILSQNLQRNFMLGAIMLFLLGIYFEIPNIGELLQ